MNERTMWDYKVGGQVAQILEVVGMGLMSVEEALAQARRNSEALDDAEWAEVERQVREALDQ